MHCVHFRIISTGVWDGDGGDKKNDNKLSVFSLSVTQTTRWDVSLHLQGYYSVIGGREEQT